MSRIRARLDARTLMRAEQIIARREPSDHRTPSDARTFLRYLARRLRGEGA